MHTITESGITIDPQKEGVFLSQDVDTILVEHQDCAKMRDVFARLAKEHDPISADEYEKVFGR